MLLVKMNKNLAPIVLFVYNRPWHTEQTLNALMQNDLADQSILYIYSDGPKVKMNEKELLKIETTRQIIRNKKYCKEVVIIESSTNKGLADSIIDGVTTIVNKHGKIIVLEDDLVSSKGFLRYMNDALNKLAEEEKVMQISGYMFPLKITPTGNSFFLPMATSWGWATWKRSWYKFDPLASGYQELRHHHILAKKFDLNGSYPYTNMLFQQMENRTLDSWAIRWWWSIFKEKGITLFPDCSLINNIGFDREGTHTHYPDPFLLKNFDNSYIINKFPLKIKVSKFYFKKVIFFLQCANSNKKYFSKLILFITMIRRIAFPYSNKKSE